MRGTWLVVAWGAVVACALVHTSSLDANDRSVRVIELAAAPVWSPGTPYTSARTTLTLSGAALVAAWGDDRGLLAEVVHRGPTLPDHRAIGWSTTGVWVVDTATGQPVQRVRWPSTMTERHQPAYVAVDPTGRWIAAGDDFGDVTLGGLDGSDFAPLTRDAARASHVPRRLFFSPDGARLATSDGVWETTTRRALVPLRADQELVAVDPTCTRAVATTVVDRLRTEGPGSGCGFVRTFHDVFVTAAEALDLTAGTATALPLGAVSETVTGLHPPTLPTDEVVAMHPVDDVDLDARGDLAVVDANGAWQIGDREARRVALAPPMHAPTALHFTDDGLVARAANDGSARTITVTVPLVGDGRRALVDGIQSRPNRHGAVVVRDSDRGWSLWDLRGMTRVRALPDTGPLGLDANDQALVSEDGDVVLRDEAPGQHVFLVAEGSRWRRVTVPAAQPPVWMWELARDGRHVAFVDGATMRVVALRDGRVRADVPVEGNWDTLALSDERVAVGDDRGRVRVLDLDGVERARIDLSGRFDHATAMAFRPDGGALAVGTARGRVFVFRWVP